jgi:hypothetical protein
MEIGLFVIRLAVLAALYGFLATLLWLVWRELRWVAVGPTQELVRPAGLLVIDCGETGLSPGDVLRLERVTTHLGRAPGSSIVLSDPSVSVRHAVLTYEHGYWWVQDAGSTNGTLLNGVATKQKLPLRAGDVLTLGQVRLRLEDDLHAQGGRQ